MLRVVLPASSAGDRPGTGVGRRGTSKISKPLTGALMHWNRAFSDDWRTGATFVHDWAYLALTALVIAHIGRALREPVPMTSMTTGCVPLDWAERERPGWAKRVTNGTQAATGRER
jgi:formate dehydrogenase subunit gamma